MGSPPTALVLEADDERAAFVASSLAPEFDVHQAAPAGAAAGDDGLTTDVVVLGLDGEDQDTVGRLLSVRALHDRIPMVVVSWATSVDLAVAAVNEGAYGFLRAPLDGQEILAMARRAVGSARARKVLQDRLSALERRGTALALSARDLRETAPTGRSSHVTLEAFVCLTAENIIESLWDLTELAGALARGRPSARTCHFLGCPSHDLFEQVLVESTRVLDKTRSSFKSKELGQLRRRLETLLDELREELRQ